VSTSAVCVSAVDNVSNGYCDCGNITVSKVTTVPGGTCTVTSDTGSCSASGGSLGTEPFYTGQCCVCAP
jgi:hypothetical protein